MIAHAEGSQDGSAMKPVRIALVGGTDACAPLAKTATDIWRRLVPCRIGGTRPGEACSVRDLPLELSHELARRGIDLYLYYTGDGPYLDAEIGSRFGFTEPRFLGVTRRSSKSGRRFLRTSPFATVIG